MKEYSVIERRMLLKLAQDSIACGLQNGREIQINLTDYPSHLSENRASFVTLNMHEQLRGCIGSLVAYQPLVVDVASNAFKSAFTDPRFSPLTTKEFPQISIHISVLSVPQPMSFSSEADLVSQLHPGIDGLILADKGYQGTFLPAVWESLPDPKVFLQHLKLKAGLSADYWSETIKIERYTAELIE